MKAKLRGVLENRHCTEWLLLKMQLINSIRNRFVIMKGLRMSVVSQYLALIQAY